jgi:hypothetical protein
MGAWGYKPMENDYAADWMACNVEQPIVETIRKTFQDFLGDGQSNDVRKHEAEAAVALLIDLGGYPRPGKYSAIDIREQAKTEGLWNLATMVVRKLCEDREWLSSWSHPEEKNEVLSQLLADITELPEADRPI